MAKSEKQAEKRNGKGSDTQIEKVTALLAEFCTEVAGKLTFSGAALSFWSDLCKKWAISTQERYARHYKIFLIPYFLDKPLEEYLDPAYLEYVINDIPTKINPGKSKEQQVQHLRHILYLLIEIASRKLHLPNPLIDLDNVEDCSCIQTEAQMKKIARTQKSFSPEQEYAIAESIFSDPLCSGQRVGLLIMFVFGCRNKEACGLTWGDIHPMMGEPRLYKLFLHTSVIENTRKARTGGKTDNMFRIFPIPPKVFAYLMQRKEHIENLVKTGEYQLPEGIKSVNFLPIACHNWDWAVRCTSSELSLEGQCVFENIGLAKDQRAFFRERPDDSDGIGILAWDKDPTTYTFRRNFATHLSCLGLKTEEVQYLMGHKMAGDTYQRHNFANDDLLRALHEKLRHRPIVNDVDFGVPEMVLEDDWSASGVYRQKIIVPPTAGRLYLTLRSNASHVPCTITVKPEEKDHCPKKLRMKFRHLPCEDSGAGFARSLRVYHDAYAKGKELYEKAQAKKVGETEEMGEEP